MRLPFCVVRWFSLIVTLASLLNTLAIFFLVAVPRSQHDPVGDEPVRPAPTTINDFRNFNYELYPSHPLRPNHNWKLAKLATPIVSVVSPFFNNWNFFAGPSILGQSLQNLEWVIANDGSTKALEQLNKWRGVPRVRILDRPVDRGVSAARNNAIRSVQSPYVLFIDGDDFPEPTLAEKAVWFLETHPQMAMVNFWSVGFGAKNYTWRRGFQDGNLNLKENCITIATMVRRSALVEVGGFNETISLGAEDYDLWLHLAEHGYWGWTIPEIGYWYRVSPPGKWPTMDRADAWAQFQRDLRERHPAIYKRGIPVQERQQSRLVPPSVREIVHNVLEKHSHRILFVIRDAVVGGADMWNRNLMSFLVTRGWQVSVVVVGRQPEETSTIPQVLRFTPDVFILERFLPLHEYLNFLIYIIKSRQIDIVLITNTELGYSFLPSMHMFAPQATYVDFAHSETEEWKHGGYPRYSIQYRSLLHRSIVLSEHLRQWVIRRGHSPATTAVVHPGIPESWVDPLPSAESRRLIRAELGIPVSAVVVVYSARIEPKKLPIVFARTIENLALIHSNLYAIVAGSGPELPALRKRLAQVPAVRFLAVRTSAEQLRPYIHASDIIFLPTVKEGISLALLEGMGLGLIPVSVDVGGQRELVTNETGYLIPLAEDVRDGDSTVMTSQFIAIIDGLIRNASLRNILGRNARDIVRTSWLIQNMGEEMLRQFSIGRQTELLSDRTALTLEALSGHLELSQLELDAGDIWAELQSHRAQLAATISLKSAFFESGIQLVGCQYPRRIITGQSCAITLLWACVGCVPDASLTIFVHFRHNATNTILFNMDHFPSTPTSQWRDGEIVRDTSSTIVPAVPEGPVTIVIGCFHADTGKRLQLLSPRHPDQELVIGELSILAANP